MFIDAPIFYHTRGGLSRDFLRKSETVDYRPVFCCEFALLKRFQKRLELCGEDLMSRVVEVEPVRRVFFLVLGEIGVDAECIVKIQHGNVKLLCGLLDDVYVSQNRHCVRAFYGACRGDVACDPVVTAARGGHENDRFTCVFCAQKVHEKIYRAAEGCGGGVTHFSHGSVAVDIIVDAAVDHDDVGVAVQVVCAAAEAEVVAWLFAGGLLVCQARTANAVIMCFGKLAFALQDVVVSVVFTVKDPRSLGDAVPQKVNDLTFQFHMVKSPCGIFYQPSRTSAQSMRQKPTNRA